MGLIVERFKYGRAARAYAVSRRFSHISSSWISTYSYDPYTKVLYMVTRGKMYSWFNVSEETAQKVLEGQASCRTDDPTGQGRWFVGKTPSLGAAFWQLLKGHSFNDIFDAALRTLVEFQFSFDLEFPANALFGRKH